MFFPMLVLLIKHLARVFDVEILGRVTAAGCLSQPVEVVTCHVGGEFGDFFIEYFANVVIVLYKDI